MVDRVVLSIAKNAIEYRLGVRKILDRLDLIKQYPFLDNYGASFVTLNKNGNLRGCIGSIVAHRKLIDDIYSNAVSAAFSDPRFNPITGDELSDLTIEVSILTKPQKLEYEDYLDLISKVTPHKDGVILKYGQYQGTFLPQVWEQLPDRREFLDHLSHKAGANPEIYKYNPEIYIYRVESVEDSFDAIF